VWPWSLWWTLLIHPPTTEDIIELVDHVDLEEEAGFLQSPDGTSWSWDAGYLAYADDDAVWVGDLLDGSIYNPEGITHDKVHEASGRAAFAPYGSLALAVQVLDGALSTDPSSVVHGYNSGDSAGARKRQGEEVRPTYNKPNSGFVGGVAVNAPGRIDAR